MCGIYITNIPFEESTVVDKLKKINFRGPDNLGYKKINLISLAHLRLSILDLDVRSNQPFRHKNLSIVFNGEIYNFKEIRTALIPLGYSFNTTSDTEVLLKGYDAWNKDIVQRLNGMFAFSIYDSDKNIIFSARDRLGVKPFYYYWKEGKLEICSQLRPLINAESRISNEAVSIYLDCGYVPSPYSILEDVYKLPPGNSMEIDLNTNTLHIKTYWDLKPVKIRDISYEDAKSELHELLTDAVRIRLQSDVPLGTFLSGGVDSALVSAIATKISSEQINTFTIGFEDPKFDESKIARQFSEIIDSNHNEHICGPNDALQMLDKLVEVYDEPFADSSALPSLLLNSIVKDQATVALSGDGGDESFFGYRHFDSVNKFAKLKWLPITLRNNIASILPRSFPILGKVKEIFEIRSERHFMQSVFTGYTSLQKNRNTSWLQRYKKYYSFTTNPLQRAADLNIKLWLENDSNVKVDRASMAYSVEVRSPFLDYRIIEFARTLPVDYRYQKGNKKRILKDILSEYIDRSVFEQPKKGFAIPMKEWSRNELKEEILEALNDDFLHKVPNLNLTKFKKEMKEHFNAETNNMFSIWKLYILSRWYKEFGF